MKLVFFYTVILLQFLFADQSLKTVLIQSSELDGKWRIDEDLFWDGSDSESKSATDPILSLTMSTFEKKGINSVGNYQYWFTEESGRTEIYEIKIMRYSSKDAISLQWNQMIKNFDETKYQKINKLGDDCYYRTVSAPKYVFRKGNFYVSLMSMGGDSKLKLLAETFANKIH